MSVFRSDTDAYSLRWLTALIALQRDPEVALMLAGHTHERMVRRIEGLTVVNAGTLHRDDAPGFIIVDFTIPEVRGFDVEDGQIREAERYPL
jgi:predicted phosphodiesterase